MREKAVDKGVGQKGMKSRAPNQKDHSEGNLKGIHLHALCVARFLVSVLGRVWRSFSRRDPPGILEGSSRIPPGILHGSFRDPPGILQSSSGLGDERKITLNNKDQSNTNRLKKEYNIEN